MTAPPRTIRAMDNDPSICTDYIWAVWPSLFDRPKYAWDGGLRAEFIDGVHGLYILDIYNARHWLAWPLGYWLELQVSGKLWIQNRRLRSNDSFNLRPTLLDSCRQPDGRCDGSCGPSDYYAYYETYGTYEGVTGDAAARL